MSRQKYFTFAGFLDLGNIINIISGETQSVLRFPLLLIGIGFIRIFDHCVCRAARYIGADVYKRQLYESDFDKLMNDMEKNDAIY